jgi:signal transduction histidine kinase
MFKGRQLELASIDAKQRVTEFELATKEGLIKALYTTNTSLGEHVKAWADYFFSDHFSLWIYNKYTKAFTCSISSFDSPRNFIFESEDQSLNDVLATDYEAECRAPNQDWVVLTKSPDIKTINRMKLVLGFDGTIGVLTFYSRHEDFALRPKNYSEISNSIERKYLQDSQRAQHAVHEINRRFIETYEAGKLNEFLYNIVYQVTQSFQVEACSIFLVDGIREHLELIASHDNHTQGKPQDQYSYLVTDKTPSAEVYRTGEMAFSYNLAVDDPNNEGYNESTDHVPTNWIGAPLISAGTCFGVLRVRNKFERGENNESSITNFHSDDFRNLLSLCSNLSNLIKLESLFIETETRLENTNASMVEMNDFNKVFLHEIRTPISKFTMAPEIIKRTLGRKDLSQSNLDKVMKQLDDIQVMGDRLGFIAKTFNFDQIVTRRHFETLSVLRDIVFPVINITRAYLRKQYDIDIDLNSTGLQSSRVYGDKTLLNIVFNTLIDNAGKYSVGTRRPINVSGSYYGRGDHFDIVVSNYGLEIHEDEVANLFEKGVRGREVIKHGIGGTGIGLHLAQRIMSEGEGDLLLTSIKDPVSFTIRIPVREKGARA